jgi:hypothetical protein
MLQVCRALTSAQLGAVMRLSEHYADNGSLPERPADLCRIVGIPGNKWSANFAKAQSLVLLHRGFLLSEHNVYPRKGGKQYTLGQGVKSTPRERVLNESKSDTYEFENVKDSSRAHFPLIYKDIKERDNREPVSQMPLRDLSEDISLFDVRFRIMMETRRSQVEAMCMQGGIPQDGMEAQVLAFLKRNEQTQYANTAHMLNSFRFWAEKYLEKSQKKSEPRSGGFSYTPPGPVQTEKTKLP